MYTFNELKKAAKKDMSGYPVYRLAVVGDCATQHISQAFKGYAHCEGIALEVLDTDYDQILAQITDASSEIYSFGPDALCIIMCSEKLYDAFTRTAEEQRGEFAEKKASEISSLWECFKRHRSGAKLIQFNFPELDDRVMGNYGGIYSGSFIYQQRLLNMKLSELASECAGVSILDASYVQNMMGRNSFCDSKLYYSAKMPFSLSAIPALACELTGIVKAAMAKMVKCVVLDLDNTLWGGVIGDDGVDGIEIGELGTGHAYAAFQEWLKELTKTGIILAVCSKNDEGKAKEPFISHPEMVLRLEDFAIFVANWEDKASNIRYIAKTLNLGLDSFVFIDDNPFEREQVRAMIPQITVPEMPEDPAEYVGYLRSCDLFERLVVSEADKDRTRQYREEAGRAVLKAHYEDYDDYLKDLDMEAVAAAFDEFHYPRIAQLSQRSNQFNLRTVRLSEEEVRDLALSDEHLTLYFSLKDRFGDHGLISAVILKISGDEGFIVNWFMSCRVLKRGMEEFIINTLVERAYKKGIKKIRAEYKRSAKNNMVSGIYDKMGFTALSDDEETKEYILNISGYTPQKTHIKESLA